MMALGSRRTSKAKIAILGSALPLRSNPLTVAEEHAMIDNITGGRLISGFVRGIGAEWLSADYFRHVHSNLATRYTPEDNYIANLMGALAQIDAGCTTLVDWCHNNPTPAHTDAAVEALDESGIRAAFFHGSPKPDPKPGQKPFWEVPHPRAEVERRHLSPADLDAEALGHFGFFRKSMPRKAWDEIADWLIEKVPRTGRQP